MKVELDYVVELSKEGVHSKRWKCGIIDEHEETSREEGGFGDMDRVNGSARKGSGRR